MSTRVQGCVTAGVALVSAGVLAALPVAQEAPEVVRSVNADVELAAASDNPVEAASGLGEGFGEASVRFASSLATAPLGLGSILAAAAAGENQALYDALEAYIDGPNYVFDPIVFAVDDVLPAPIGGDPSTDPTNMHGSAVSRFRADVLLAARDDVREAVADALGVAGPNVEDAGPIYTAARLGTGLAASGARAVQSAAIAPFGLVAIVQGLQESFETGDNTALYDALEAYIDGPNYVVDPIVFAVDDVLPAPIGSDPATDPTQMDGSEVSRFRANTLLAARDNVREAVAGALDLGTSSSGVASQLNTNSSGAQLLNNAVANEGSSTAAGATETDRPAGPISRITKSLRATAGSGASTETATTGAKHRAQTGGLGGLFKKRETKSDAAPEPTN